MTLEEARAWLAELELQGRIAHVLGDYDRRNKLFSMHDDIALAIHQGRFIPVIVPKRRAK